MVIRIAALCAEEAQLAFRRGIQLFSQGERGPVQAEFYEGRPDFLRGLPQGRPWDLVIVAFPGAGGMEAVVSARTLMPDTPLLWCSDDRDFAVASYRLRCSLFLPLPLESEEVAEALGRCLGDGNIGTRRENTNTNKKEEQQ